MVAPELDRRVPVEPHLRTLVQPDLLAGLLVDVPRELRRQLGRAGQRRHVVDPAAAGEGRVGVHVVRLPEGAPVRREREATDLDAVSHHPGRRRQRRDTISTAATARHPRAVPEQIHREEERQRRQARVAEQREPEDDPERGAEPDRSLLGDQQSEHERGGAEQLVEDLAVDVDVVPDQIRVQRRDEGGDQPRSRRQEAPSRPEDDEGGSGRDDDLRDSRPRASAARSPSRTQPGTSRRPAVCTQRGHRGRTRRSRSRRGRARSRRSSP